MNITIPSAPDFSFDQCVTFLQLSEKEIVHSVQNGAIVKVFRHDGGLSKLTLRWEDGLVCEVAGAPVEKETVNRFVQAWLDPAGDLSGFYAMAEEDSVLHKAASRYRGLRIVGIPNLFEALSWAVIGQQINLTFAYTLKRRLVEAYGAQLDGHYAFPTAETLAGVDIDELRAMQFSGRKAEYILGIAKQVASGELSVESIRALGSYDLQRRELIKLRGVGPWTADYVLMKTIRQPNAFLIADVGLHNAIKDVLGQSEKPSIAEIERMAAPWHGHESLATFYLWRSLYDSV